MNLEQKLRATKPTSEPPPFMHARIVNSLKAPEVAKRLGVRRFFAAFTFVTAIILIAALIPRAQRPRPVAIELPTVPQITLPPNASLQQEMENLKTDTRNAARALAANFLPSQP